MLTWVCLLYSYRSFRIHKAFFICSEKNDDVRFYQYLFIYLLFVFCFSLKIYLSFGERLILNSLMFNSRK